MEVEVFVIIMSVEKVERFFRRKFSVLNDLKVVMRIVYDFYRFDSIYMGMKEDDDFL